MVPHQELCLSFFFFQAEDGIRDLYVTGVQTCALPIFEPLDAERWDKDFLFVLLSSFVVYDQIARRANLTAQANIGKEEFEGIYLPIPHPIEQKAIATALLSYDSAIRAEKDWAWKLQEVKSGLMTDLLTGRVRVPETK